MFKNFSKLFSKHFFIIVNIYLNKCVHSFFVLFFLYKLKLIIVVTDLLFIFSSFSFNALVNFSKSLIKNFEKRVEVSKILKRENEINVDEIKK